MGGVVSGITGGGGKGGSSGSTTTGGSNVATGLENLAATQYGYGQDVMQSALPQYQTAASNLTSGSYNQMTPAQQALLGTMAGEQNLNTTGTYSNLGLGGSTMESQDQNANQLRSLAEQSNLAQQNFNQQTAIEQLGLQGVGTGESLLGGAGTSTAALGNLQNAQTNQLTSALSGLGNKSAGSGVGNALDSAGTSIMSLFGG